MGKTTMPAPAPAALSVKELKLAEAKQIPCGIDG
jgi:hypothetical protein